ncbi:hypothetical protein UlMin_031652 [Ulmus minor]
MVRPLFLSLSLCLFLLINSSLARQQFQHEQQSQQNQCQFDRLEAREPDNRIRSEAGEIETWNPNRDQFRCAGVAIVRHTIEPNGLHLPSYTNAPQLAYVVRGRGVVGTIFPGCPETFEDSQQGGRQGQQEHEEDRRHPRSREEQREREEHCEREEREREEDNRRPHSREEQREREERPEREEREREEQHRRPRSREEQREREEERGRSSRSQPDRHQKVRHIKEGDIVALPAGVAYWSYNNGNEPLVVVTLLDVNNNENQLDQNPRRFYLAGNPQEEFNVERQHRILFKRGEQSEGNNVFSGFNDNFLQEAFQVNAETARKIQNRNDNRGAIIRVEGQLDFVGPPRSQQEREREERREEDRQREREHSRRQGRQGYNGIEESFCTMRLRENIGDPSRADLYSPQAGRLTTANRYNLPILSWLQLSAERGFLYNNRMYVPHYNINANSVIYVIRGRARVQVVDDNGNSVFDGEVRQGQVLTVPQNFAVVKRAESEEGFEWVAFKTNDVAKVHPLAGRISYIWALPEDVIANAYQISNEQARRLKYNRQESSMFRVSSRSERFSITA